VRETGNLVEKMEVREGTTEKRGSDSQCITGTGGEKEMLGGDLTAEKRDNNHS